MRTTAFAPLAVCTTLFKISLFSILLTKPICLRTHSAVSPSTYSSHRFQNPEQRPSQVIWPRLISLQTTSGTLVSQPSCERTTSQLPHTMDRRQEGSRVQSACRQCIESHSPCNGQVPCHRCGHYSLSCVYLNRAHPTCLECSRNISECDGESPCQGCRQRASQCVYSPQVEMDRRANTSAVVASQPEEAWPDQGSFESRSVGIETRPTAASARFGTREGGLETRETRHETREPDSYFIKEHNRGIDEDHLAKFKPGKKEWKMDRIG